MRCIGLRPINISYFKQDMQPVSVMPMQILDQNMQHVHRNKDYRVKHII